MKALSLLLAAVGGTGFFFHNQLQSWWNSPSQTAQSSPPTHQAPEGVYYLRTPCYFTGQDGAAVRWSPGQELRTAQATMHGVVTLTDGVNTWQVPETAVTRDMDDAAALRRADLASQNIARAAAEQEASRKEEAARQANAKHLVSGQFHSTTLDAPTVRTNLPENIVSTAGAPVLYPVYVVRGTQQPANAQVHAKTTRNTAVLRTQSNRNPAGTTLVNGQ